MRRALAICALLLLPALAAGEDRAEQDFVAANELALAGDLTGAIALYKTLLDQGVEHEDLYYNLGNAYAQSGKYVDAVLAYERALRLAPDDADARANMELVRAQLAGTKGEAPPAEEAEVVLADVVEPIVAPLPRALFGWAAAGANALLFGALVLRRRARKDGTRKLAGAGALAATVVLACGLAVVGAHFIVARDPRAVVTETSEVKEGPHVRFKVSGRVGGGERVRVLEEDGGFVKVLRRDGTSGWIPTRSIVRV